MRGNNMLHARQKILKKVKEGEKLMRRNGDTSLLIQARKEMGEWYKNYKTNKGNYNVN